VLILSLSDTLSTSAIARLSAKSTAGVVQIIPRDEFQPLTVMLMTMGMDATIGMRWSDAEPDRSRGGMT
jgi:hypothetical protein